MRLNRYEYVKEVIAETQEHFKKMTTVEEDPDFPDEDLDDEDISFLSSSLQEYANTVDLSDIKSRTLEEESAAHKARTKELIDLAYKLSKLIVQNKITADEVSSHTTDELIKIVNERFGK